MIVNILKFSFREDTTEEERAEVLALMRRTAAVESVSFSTVGPSFGGPTNGFTHAYCVGIADLAALERYMHDPVHVEGDLTILPRLARLTAFRLTDDATPDLDARVGALHQAKLDAYPEWARTLERLA